VKLSRLLFLIIALTSLQSKLVWADDEPGEGQIAPDFTITKFDGQSFKLSDYRGKKSVYLIFWNTWCTYCMKKIPKLKHAQSHLNDEIEIIAVNTGLKDSVKKSVAFQKRYEINYPLAFDHDKKVTDLYGVWGTPTEFIIDIDGIIRHRDGVPDSIEENLVVWNKPASEEILAGSDDACNSDNQKTC